ncbi:MAG: hypothetical protein H7X86_11210 [Gorillibacterium sp.]|nr:hypothetical protein [Gorillibacterium sp.]
MTNIYQWDNIPIGGGGYVTGIIAHPQEKNLIYVRTDVGGAFRWDPEDLRWISLCESFSFEERNFFGIDGIALDPNDLDVVYMAAGEFTYHPLHDVLKSTDRGVTWKRTNLNKMFAGNMDYRWAGEPIAVDPHNGQIVYVGTRYDGLWVSRDGAETWGLVLGIPIVLMPNSNPLGVRAVIFDPASNKEGVTQTIYASVVGSGVYQSSDGGAEWHFLDGSPIHPIRMALGNDGVLIVTSESGVYQYDGSLWTDISPKREQPYCAIAVDPTNRKRIVVVQLHHQWNNPIYLSVDSGVTWKNLNEISDHKADVPWWPKGYFSAATASAVFLPHRPGALWYTDWYGVWMTDDLEAERVSWYTRQSGHEEMCAFTMTCSPAGAPLITAIADNGGMRHENFDEFPIEKLGDPLMQETTGIDFVESNPDIIVRVGSWEWGNHGSGGWSNDQGVNWREFKNYPTGSDGLKMANGKVAVSAIAHPVTELPNIVVLPIGSAPWVSADMGLTWTKTQGAPEGIIAKFWSWNIPLASDRVDANVFYMYGDGGFYRSEDGGYHWSHTVALPRESWHIIKTVPGHKGHVWVGLNDQGLYLSQDGGDTFVKMPKVEKAYLFSLGMPTSLNAYSMLFVYGRIEGQNGIFISEDTGANWHKISNDEYQVGAFPCCMEGDRQTLGVVYIGTQGRGYYRGSPNPL